MEKRKIELLNAMYNTCALTSNEKIVAQYFVCKSNEEGICSPSVETIAIHCGVSVRTVQRVTKKLQEKNYIVMKKRYDNGRQSSNVYELNLQHYFGI